MRLARTKMVRQEFFSRKLVPTSDAIKGQLKGRGVLSCVLRLVLNEKMDLDSRPTLAKEP